MSNTMGLKIKGWVYKVPIYIYVKQKNKKVSELTIYLEQKLKVIFCCKTFKNSSVFSMSLIESTTLYKSIILLQVTLTEPGLGSLTTES